MGSPFTFARGDLRRSRFGTSTATSVFSDLRLMAGRRLLPPQIHPGQKPFSSSAGLRKRTIHRQCDCVASLRHLQHPALSKLFRIFQIASLPLLLTCVSLTWGTLTTPVDSFPNLNISKPSPETDRRPTPPLPSHYTRVASKFWMRNVWERGHPILSSHSER